MSRPPGAARTVQGAARARSTPALSFQGWLMHRFVARTIRIAGSCWLLGGCSFKSAPLYQPCAADTSCVDCYAGSMCPSAPGPEPDAAAIQVDAGPPSVAARQDAGAAIQLDAEPPSATARQDAGAAIEMTTGCEAGGCSRCPGESQACGGECFELRSDPRHCGACGHTCPAAKDGEARCNNGSCSSVCPAGFIECSGACVDANSHDSCGSCQACAHCGTCGSSCTAPAHCRSARCVSE